MNTQENRLNTEAETALGERILIIGAHPDDAVLGCGGTIARCVSEGARVFYCVATRAYTPDWTAAYVANQLVELEASNRILGITKTFYLNFPAAGLDTIPQKKINDSLWQIVSDVKPHSVFVHNQNDINVDHRLLFDAALVATRPTNGRIKRLLTYTTLEFGQLRAPFTPDVYIDIRATLGVKIQAMAAFPGEMRPYPHPRSPEVITALAQKWGSEAGLYAAEAFRLIREII
jgi:N-acetylglucosamine malate deacetylase 1